MRKAFLVLALTSLAACTTATFPAENPRLPRPGSLEANPQLVTGEKNLPGMEGLDWRTAGSDVHTEQDGMLPRITIEGCLFSRHAFMKRFYPPEARLDGIVLRYIGLDADFQDCARKVTAYFTGRLGPNPMSWEGARYWFGFNTEIAIGTAVEKQTYSFAFPDKERFFISYAPVGTLDNNMRIEE